MEDTEERDRGQRERERDRQTDREGQREGIKTEGTLMNMDVFNKCTAELKSASAGFELTRKKSPKRFIPQSLQPNRLLSNKVPGY